MLSDIIDCINIDCATDNEFQIARKTSLELATDNLQNCIGSLAIFIENNKK